MSGAAFERIKRDVLDRMKPSDAARFFVFSDSAAQVHAWQKGSWHEEYNYAIAPEDRARIHTALSDAARESGVMAGAPDTSRILDRETSVAWTALSPDATRQEKREWDTGNRKRISLLAAVRRKLPEFNVTIGGKTTIDVTREGISKEFGVRWLATELAIDPYEMLFIGDGFYEGGNDAVVIPTGIQTRETTGPAETLDIIEDLLKKNTSKKT
jgi:hydroxymethylpyrimidine pyrophosphatase-like HAD family hydrolase